MSQIASAAPAAAVAAHIHAHVHKYCIVSITCSSPERLLGDVLTGETEGVREEE